MKIKLLTRDGEFVRDGNLPPFNPPPQVITWGTRAFVHGLAFHPTDANNEPAIYLEGLMYPLEVADGMGAASTGDWTAAPEAQPSMADAAEMLWVVLANVSGGDWTKQTPEWQEYAARWRDNYFAALKVKAAPSTGDGLHEHEKLRIAERTAAPEAQPAAHFWTPDETKNRCMVCGDGPWGRHRFQAAPEAQPEGEK